MRKGGIDLDGCLANFESGFAPILTDLTGITFPLDEPTFPEVWQWPTLHLTNSGMSEKEAKAVESAAWKRVTQDPAFWLSLKPYPETASTLKSLTRLTAEGHEIYFITHRPGANPKRQSEIWLEINGYKRESPTVLVSGEKGFLAAGLGLDFFIDDKPENHEQVRRFCGTRCRRYIVDHPYNRHHDDKYAVRVTTVKEALELEFAQ